jgi:hypothetical protein
MKPPSKLYVRQTEGKQLWEYEYPEEPPEHYFWAKEYKWSCPVHEYDVNEGSDCSELCCTECELCLTAANVWTGRWQLYPDLSTTAKLIRDIYLPAVTEQLNSEVLLHELSKHPETG